MVELSFNEKLLLSYFEYTPESFSLLVQVNKLEYFLTRVSSVFLPPLLRAKDKPLRLYTTLVVFLCFLMDAG